MKFFFFKKIHALIFFTIAFFVFSLTVYAAQTKIPSYKKGVVLFAHWLNDPYARDISSRTEVDTALDKAKAGFKEFSYGKFSADFDVCEVNAKVGRPEMVDDIIKTAF